MEAMQNVLQPLFGSELWVWAGYMFFLNPLVMLPQLKSAITSPADSLVAISRPMLVGFVVMQVLTVLVSIQTGNRGMFAAMALSVIISLLILLVVTIRRRG